MPVLVGEPASAPCPQSAAEAFSPAAAVPWLRTSASPPWLSSAATGSPSGATPWVQVAVRSPDLGSLGRSACPANRHPLIQVAFATELAGRHCERQGSGRSREKDPGWG